MAAQSNPNRPEVRNRTLFQLESLEDRLVPAFDVVSAPPDINGTSNGPSTAGFQDLEQVVSADGRFVVFDSTATDLVAKFVDGNDVEADVFLYDRLLDEVTLVSHTGDQLTSGDGASERAIISADGSTIVFSSGASDLDATVNPSQSGSRRLYVWRRDPITDPLTPVTGAVTLITRDADDNFLGFDQESFSISGDGRAIVFGSGSKFQVENFVDNNGVGLNDLYLWEQDAAGVTKISLITGKLGSATESANGDNVNPRISRDGNTIAFTSNATDLDGSVTDNNKFTDVFVWSRNSVNDPATVRLISRNTNNEVGNDDSGSSLQGGTAEISISADGNAVAFSSEAMNLDLTVNDTKMDRDDVFVWRDGPGAGTVALISKAADGTVADGPSDDPVISGDGTAVAFQSIATNLVPDFTFSSLTDNIYLWNQPGGTGATTLRLISSIDGKMGSGGGDAVISADGKLVAFTSFARKLDPTFTVSDKFSLVESIYVFRDANEGNAASLRLLNRGASIMDGTAGPTAEDSRNPAVADNGTVVSFLSDLVDLVPNDNNAGSDVFIQTFEDFGDAADTYGIAQHGTAGVRLGTNRDAEEMAPFSKFADGDDTVPGTADDEDGLVSQGQLEAGQMGTVTVNLQNVTGTQFLNAWVDWDRDGTFDPEEQIADGLKITANGDFKLPEFMVPTGSIAANDYVTRFRVSDTEKLGPTGLALNGEVEDHLLTVGALPPIVYVSTTFTNAVGTKVDGDLSTPGEQAAIIGTDAFVKIADALNAVAPTGKVLINGGTYDEVLDANSPVTLIFADVTVNSFTADQMGLKFAGLGNNTATLRSKGDITISDEVMAEQSLKLIAGQGGTGGMLNLNSKITSLLADGKIMLAGNPTAGTELLNVKLAAMDVALDLGAGTLELDDLIYQVADFDEVVSDVAATNLMVKLADTNDTVVLDDDGTVENFFSKLSIGPTTVKFFHPTELLSLDLAGGNDILTTMGVDTKLIPTKIRFSGGAGDDLLGGTVVGDELFGGDGNDTLAGGLGDDTLDGEAGMDTYRFNTTMQLGTDNVADDDGASILQFVGTGVFLDLNSTDTFEVNENLKLKLDAGVNLGGFVGTEEADTVVGTDGDDTIMGMGGDDILISGAGNDMVDGGAGNDGIDGGAGNDTLMGDAGDDLIFGMLGNDSISGGDGADKIGAGDGDDSVVGGAGNDLIFGEAGNDNIQGDAGQDSIGGGAGNDTINGGLDNDLLLGEAGLDQIFGGDGADRIGGGTENDLIDGGTGNDTLFGEDGNDSVGGADGDDTVGGGAGNDSLTGGVGNDSLEGEDGDDTLRGNGGIDTVHGGAGLNQLGSNDTDELGNYLIG